MGERSGFDSYVSWKASRGRDSGKEEFSPESCLSTDDAFEILRNKRRRNLHQFLIARDGGAIELGELAEEIAADELDKSVQELTSAERKRVYVALYQCHLPKMDSVGVVEFDEDRKTVALDESATSLEKYLSLDDRESADETERTGEFAYPLVSPEDVILFTACMFAAVAVDLAAVVGAVVLLAFVAVRAAVQLWMPMSGLAS